MGENIASRRGRIYIDGPIVREGDGQIVIAMIAGLKFVPARVEYLAILDRFEYQGWCEAFDKIEEGEQLPVYGISVTKHEDGTFYFSAGRAE